MDDQQPTRIDRLADGVVRAVAELPHGYRADDPDVMQVSVNDLHDIITSRVAAALGEWEAARG